LPVAALPPTNKPSTAATVKSAERGVHGNALNEGLEACHGTSKATTGSAEDAMHQIASIGMETARTTWPHDKIQPAYRDADHSSTLESFQRVAQRVHDETSLMLSTMHAKLVELEGLQENGAGTNTNKTAVGLKTKKRAELHVFCREQQTKRQRLFSEYDSVLSMLIEQGSSTTTTTVTDCHQAPTSSSSARVSMSPSHPAATSENQDDVEIFGC
jgi:hypothetical protein